MTKLLLTSVQSCPTLCNPMDCSLPGSSVHGKNTRVSCLFLFQRIVPTQGSNPGLLCLSHWQEDYLPLAASWDFWLNYWTITYLDTGFAKGKIIRRTANRAAIAECAKGAKNGTRRTRPPAASAHTKHFSVPADCLQKCAQKCGFLCLPWWGPLRSFPSVLDPFLLLICFDTNRSDSAR